MWQWLIPSEGGYMNYPFYAAQDADTALNSMAFRNPEAEFLNRSCISCCSMLVERMLGLSFPPELCANFAVRSGVGSDPFQFSLLAGAIAGRFSLQLRYSNDPEQAIRMIADGAKSIVQYEYRQKSIQNGFVMVDSLKDKEITVLNPSYQKGKGLPRERKRMISLHDDYLLMPLEIFHEFYGENARFYLYSL